MLTLTATPIPRTLNMAFAGMRDLSIIATPPARRLAVKTFVRESHPAVIKEAILRELLRGGQVYYLHKEVDSIEKCARELAEMEMLDRAVKAIRNGKTPNMDQPFTLGADINLRLSALIQKEPKRYKLEGGDRLKFMDAMNVPATRLKMVGDVLERLAG